MTSDLRFGVVGFGGMGRTHAHTLQELEGISLVAIADPGKDARQAARGLGVAVFSDHIEMFRRTQLDGVIVSSPSNTHARVIEDACSRGINVFSEKPLTTTFADALKVREAVEGSGVVFAIGLVLRHSEAYKKAKDLIARGEIGRVGLADCRYSGYMLGVYGYVFSEELGRGLLNEHTIHMIDAMEYLLGPADSVLAATDATEEHTEYNAAILMKHASGAFTTISASGVSRLGAHARVTGLKGELLVEGNQKLVLKDGDGDHELLSAGLGYRQEIENFRDAIRESGEPLAGIDEAFESARLIEALYRSAHEGSIVRLADLPD